MKRNMHWILALVAAALVAGCATGSKPENAAPVADRSATAVVPETAPPAAPAAPAAPVAPAPAVVMPTAIPAPQSRVAPVAIQAPAASQVAMPEAGARVVRFDYDSFVIKPESQAIIESNANFLKANPSRRIAIEGHTDERGGREYNLALGQKRAEAVRRALGLLGVADNQMEAVSFGKEKPANAANTEAAYAANRRAEINYR